MYRHYYTGQLYVILQASYGEILNFQVVRVLVYSQNIIQSSVDDLPITVVKVQNLLSNISP